VRSCARPTTRRVAAGRAAADRILPDRDRRRPGGVPLDQLRFPEQFALLLRLRVYCVLALILTIALVQSPLGRRLPRTLALLAPVVASGLLFALAVVVRDAASTFYVSVNFVLIGVALLIWPAAWSALAASSCWPATC
jgi:hypothetical protein